MGQLRNIHGNIEENPWETLGKSNEIHGKVEGTCYKINENRLEIEDKSMDTMRYLDQMTTKQTHMLHVC